MLIRLTCDIQHGYPGFFALITTNLSMVNASQTEYRVCFTPLTSFVHKIMLTNRPMWTGLRDSGIVWPWQEIPGLSDLDNFAYINLDKQNWKHGVKAGETLRFYISNVSGWMECITITKTLKCVFCSVPTSDLSRNVDIKHWGVLT